MLKVETSIQVHEILKFVLLSKTNQAHHAVKERNLCVTLFPTHFRLSPFQLNTEVTVVCALPQKNLFGSLPVPNSCYIIDAYMKPAEILGNWRGGVGESL